MFSMVFSILWIDLLFLLHCLRKSLVFRLILIKEFLFLFLLTTIGFFIAFSKKLFNSATLSFDSEGWLDSSSSSSSNSSFSSIFLCSSSTYFVMSSSLSDEFCELSLSENSFNIYFFTGSYFCRILSANSLFLITNSFPNGNFLLTAYNPND